LWIRQVDAGGRALPLAVMSFAPGRRYLPLVYSLATFTTVLNIVLLSPLLKPIAGEFSRSESGVGLLATVTAACAFVTALAVAPLLDRYPRRVWLRLEVGLVAASAVLSATAGSFEVLLLARALAGVGGAVIAGLCYASAADNFPDPHERNRVVARITASATLGSILGLPVMTMVADRAGWRWAVFLMAPLALLVFAGAGTLREAPSAPPAGGVRGWWSGYRRVLSRRDVAALLGVTVLIIAIRFGWFVYVGAYAEDTFGAEAGILSLVFAVAGTAQIVASLLMPRILRVWSPRRVVTVAATVMAANLAVIGVYGDGVWTLFPFVTIGSAAWSACFLSTNLLLLDAIPSARGTVGALQSAGLELGIAVGTAVGGGLLGIFGTYESAFRTMALFVPVVFLLLLVAAPRSESDRTDQPAQAQAPAG
jgi:predicted MFS family arabinose efflux permease